MSEALALPPERLPDVRGKLTQDAPLAKLVWFKAGGAADWLFEPADLDDLILFLERLDGALPIMPLGLGSNLIVRDGGVAGPTRPRRRAGTTARGQRGRRGKRCCRCCHRSGGE